MSEQNNIETFSIPAPENIGEAAPDHEVVGNLLHSLKLPNGERVLYDPSESDQLVQLIGTDGEVREEFRAGSQIVTYESLREIKQRERAGMFGNVAAGSIDPRVEPGGTHRPENHGTLGNAQSRKELLAGFYEDEERGRGPASEIE